jgi:hypothetical protein
MTLIDNVDLKIEVHGGDAFEIIGKIVRILRAARYNDREIKKEVLKAAAQLGLDLNDKETAAKVKKKLVRTKGH